MIRLLSYLLRQGVVTSPDVCPPLDDANRGMPELTDSPCVGSNCNVCADVCPTVAIEVSGQDKGSQVSLDLGSCIACGLCIQACPTGTIKANRSSRIASSKRQDLVLSNSSPLLTRPASSLPIAPGIFRDALAIRVVSTGCSACDLEVAAAGNPIFDMDRFGIQVVASPRFADALVVTGPAGKGMKDALRRCYEAMPKPRKVIAVGTCAISGGVHKGGYTEANGLQDILPIDTYIPGCPPHPWSILHGLLLTMGRIS